MCKRDTWTSKASTVHNQLQSDGPRVNHFLCARLSLNPSTEASVLWLLNPSLNIKPPGCNRTKQAPCVKMKCEMYEPVVPVVIFCTFIPQELEAIKARVMEMEEEEEEEKLREAQYCSEKPFPYGPLQTGNHGQPNPSAQSSLLRPWHYFTSMLVWVKEGAASPTPSPLPSQLSKGTGI